MADKRKLLLEVDVDVDSKPLRQLGDDAEHAEDGFDDLNQGLKKLDQQFEDTTKRSADLRAEISKSGDLALIKDLQQAERELKKLTRDRETLIGSLAKKDPTENLKLPSLAHAGGDAAEDFGVSFISRLGPLLAKAPMGPAGAAIGGALAVAALPIIGGALAAGIIGGAGGAGLIGGITIAARDSRVKSAAGELKTLVSSELELAARPMVPAVIKSLATVRQQFLPLRDDFAEIFAGSSKFLQPLTDGALAGFTSIVAGIKDVTSSVDGAGPVFVELGHLAATVGDAIGDVLTQLSDNGDEAAAVIRLLGNALAGGIRAMGTFIDVTSGAVRPLLDMAIASANFSEAIWGWIPLLGDNITEGRDNLIDVKAALDSTVGSADAAATAAGPLAVGYQSVNDAARTAAEGAKLFNDTISGLLSGQLGLDKANLAVKQGFADLNKELRDGKRTLDDNSQAGRDNRAGILNQITALEAQRNKQIETTGVVGDANTKFDEGVEAIKRNAEKLGFNKTEVDKLIGAYRNIPGSVSTDVNANTKSATANVNNFITKLNQLDGTTVTTYIKVVDDRDGRGGYRASSSGGGGRSIEPRAGGGKVMKGQTYLVGEEGKELFTPTQNGYVHDAKATAAMASSAGSGWAKSSSSSAPVYITVQAGYIATPAQLESQLSRVVNNLIRKGKLDAIRS